MIEVKEVNVKEVNVETLHSRLTELETLHPRTTELERLVKAHVSSRDSRRGVEGGRGPQGEPGKDGVSNIPGPEGKPGRDAKIEIGSIFIGTGENLRGSLRKDGEIVYVDLAIPEAFLGKDGRDGKDSTVPGPKGDKGDPGDSIVGATGLKGDKGDSVKGEKGDKGDPGKNVSTKELYDAVEDVLSSDRVRTEFIGERGPEGKEGRPGAPMSKDVIVEVVLEILRRHRIIA